MVRQLHALRGLGPPCRLTTHQQERGQSMTRSYWLFDNRFTVHANHEDTAGRYDLIESNPASGCQTPLHRHTRYAEQFYVLEGEFTVWAGEWKAVLHAGHVFTIPAGTAHAVAAGMVKMSPGCNTAFRSPAQTVNSPSRM